ncbi:MAG: Xylosidase/arabinosidase [Candidatus Ordinivivax streblomastigis]|uniref:Xylosidase/arabinosidase n=1 Tax=Candidatus Ordinivivax streblomastigis TaxID=2540710 RepID=A0A5M8NY82_9BACT|nr:MAG: Xylosidase/arabinosidase [Candidatus Ordinivivax streblomastigis]
MKPFLLFCSLLLFVVSGKAQNPIVPPGTYIADPSAHVWQDGKMYVYGSKDESPNYYCSWEHHVLSSPDLIHWDIARHRFSSKGEDDQVPFTDAHLYAPDCQYKDGTYYLYFCTSDWKEGVATSKSPLGPFKDGKLIDLKDKSMIDPCVFIDDDGQAYYIWGQFSAKMAKLKPNMMEIDSTTIHEGVVTEKEHFFHEGGYLVKRNGIYYFLFADISRSNRPTCLGYATSDKPFGPYQYRGVIIDDDHCDPSDWTNHGSLVEFKGQWYVFYHRSTHNTYAMRKPCIEPIHFNPDGSIQEAEMTTQGVAGPLDARKKMDAERACLLFGNVFIKACAPDNELLANIHNEDKAAYKYIDFGAGVDSVLIKVNPGFKGGSIRLMLDQPWSSSVAQVEVPARIETGEPVLIRHKITKPVKGVHALWLLFLGTGDNLFDVDWFQFK